MFEANIALATALIPAASFTLPANMFVCEVATASAIALPISLNRPDSIDTEAAVTIRRPPPVGVVRRHNT